MAENFFKAQRERLNKSQFDIAVLAGCTPSAVSAWERGESTPKLKNAAMLAEVYGVTEKRVTDAIVEQSKQPTAVK
jgi:transcriptional regulator with XRE-family HTH domain